MLAAVRCLFIGLSSLFAISLVAADEVTVQELVDASSDFSVRRQAGIDLYRAGKVEAAEKVFREILKGDPHLIPVRYDLAALLVEQGRLEEGLAHYQYITFKLLPENATARHRYAIALERAGQTTAAISQLEKSLEFDEEYKEARRDLIKLLMRGKKLMQASIVSDTGVRLHSDDASFHNDHGVLLMQLGKAPAAVESFRKAVQLDDTHPDAHYNMGLALNDQWKLEEAAAQLRKAIELKPEYTDAHFNLGKVLARQGNAAEARQSLKKVIELKQGYFLAFHELGMVAQRAGDHRTAVKNFTEALRHNPGYLKSQYQLGLGMMKIGRPQLAISQFEGVLRGSPSHADARYQMGLALAKIGKGEKALVHFREALLLRPGWKEVEVEISNLQESGSESTRNTAAPKN